MASLFWLQICGVSSHTQPNTMSTRAHAIAAATAPVVEGLIAGTRAHLPGVTIVDREWGVRSRAALLPLTLGNGRVLARHEPSFSGQERVEFLNSVSKC